MSQTLDVVLPVFGLIALGYARSWTGVLREHIGESLSDFVFIVAIPVLIFRTIARADFGTASPWLIWLPYYGVFTFIWILGDWLTRRLFRRDARASLVAGIAAAYGNGVMVGIPLALAAFGDAGAVPMALIIALHLPLMMAASAILIERAERIDGVTETPATKAYLAKSVVISLSRNPVIIGIVAGIVWRLTGVPLGGVPGALVNRLAEVAATLALFAMGMSLRRYGIRGNIRAGIVLSVLKLIVMPGLVFLLARYIVPLPPVWAKVMVLAAASPPDSPSSPPPSG